MPVPEKDAHSGAILFRPTKEEKEVQTLKAELTAMKDELGDKLAEVEAIIKASKKK